MGPDLRLLPAGALSFLGPMAAPPEADTHLAGGSGSGSGSGNSLGSGYSSPPPFRGADGDISSPPSAAWDDAAPPPPPHRRGLPAHPPAVQRVKFMCSYGGRIQPRAHDHRLAYFGGETKIVTVDRSARFPQLFARLAALPSPGLAAGDMCIKYQLPGEDLDALISVTNDEDVENMILEYDRLVQRCSPSRPARLRLFLFPPAARASPAAAGFSSNVKTPDRRLFADFLDSVRAPPALLAGHISSPVVPLPVVAVGGANLPLGHEQGFGKMAMGEAGPDAGSILATGESSSSNEQGDWVGVGSGESLILKRPDAAQGPKQEPAEAPNAAAQPETPAPAACPQQQPPPRADDEEKITGACPSPVERYTPATGQTARDAAPAATHQLPFAYLQDSGLPERSGCPPSMMARVDPPTAIYVIPSPSPHGGIFPGTPLPGLSVQGGQGYYTATAVQSVAPSGSPLQLPYPAPPAATTTLAVPLNQGHAEGNGAAANGAAPHLLTAYDGAGRPLYYVRQGGPAPAVCEGVMSAYQARAATGGDDPRRCPMAQPAAAAVGTQATTTTVAQGLSPEGKTAGKPLQAS